MAKSNQPEDTTRRTEGRLLASIASKKLTTLSGAKIAERHGAAKGSTKVASVRESPASSNRSGFDSFGSVLAGVSSVLVRDLESKGLTRNDIRQIIPDRTLERRVASGENLKLEEADGLARLLRIATMARRVFQDDVLADEWLRSPNPALDDLIPIQMARTDMGGREVEAVLGRIEHGVFS